jgi:hypothetical protein
MTWQFLVPVRSDASACPHYSIDMCLSLACLSNPYLLTVPTNRIQCLWCLFQESGPLVMAGPATVQCFLLLQQHHAKPAEQPSVAGMGNLVVTCARFRRVPAVRGASRIGNFLIVDDERPHLNSLNAPILPGTFLEGLPEDLLKITMF